MVTETVSRQSPDDVPGANNQVTDIPGEDGLPYFGVAREFLTRPREMGKRMRAAYGSVYRTRFLGQRSVMLSGADALQLVLLDRDKNFSSQMGWHHSLGRLFFRGLMLLDFDEHRFHRRIMQAAFKRDALMSYVDDINAVAKPGVSAWGTQSTFRFYPAIKQLTLDVAAKAFLGLDLGKEADRINKAFVDSVAASLAVVRVPVPGLGLWRGLRARKALEQFFASQIEARRAGNGTDMFTRLCQATDEDGQQFSDEDIVDHMIFLMMAAHDTVTSSLTTAAYGLATHPEWQQRLRDESLKAKGQSIAYDDLDDLTDSACLFNEALRLWGPVPYIPRRSVRSFEYGGVRVPANAQVSVSPDSAHYDEKYWTNPQHFDPERFNDERAEHKSHPFAFSPYGGGAHKCIGMHFAQLLAKIILAEFVHQYDITIDADYSLNMQQIPIPKPSDGLPLILTPRESA
ncbi:MAG: cytochrome P450 [Pseudomonadota bacterium]